MGRWFSTDSSVRRQGRRAGRLASVAGLACALVVFGACHGSVDSKLAQVRALQSAGDQKSAAKELRSILDAQPDNPEANFRLGTALLALGRPSEAIFPLKNAERSKAYGHQAGILLAVTLLKTQNYDDAIAATDRLLAKNPKDEPALVTRAQAAIAAHDGKKALESADELLKLKPGDLSTRSLRADALAEIPERRDEAESTYKELEKADWGKAKSAPGRICVALGKLYKNEGKEEAAVHQLGDCAARYSDEASVVLSAVSQLDEMSHPKEAGAALEAAHDKHPKDDQLRSALAERWVSEDKLDQAEGLIVKGAEDHKTAAAWRAVADVRQMAGNPKGALEAVEKGLAIAPDNDELHFYRADLLVQLGRLKDAEAESKKLEADLYRKIINGRLALERHHPKVALDLFGQVEAQWPDNAGVREQAARAALELGDEKRAIQELRDATRTAPKHTDAALVLANLYFVRGQYGYAHSLAWQEIGQRGTRGPDAHLLAARAAMAEGKPKLAYRDLNDLAARRDGAFLAPALKERAQIDERLLGPKAARERLEKSIADGKLDLADPKNEGVLRALAHLDEATGHRDAAVARVDKLLAAHPDAARLYALRGQLRLHAGDDKAASADFDKALSIDSHQAFALAGQGILLRRSGDAKGAVVKFDEAAKADPGVPEFPYLAAQAVLSEGDTKDARARLEKLIQTSPGYAPACNDLAWLMVQGSPSPEELGRALELANRAVRLGGGAEMLDTLGYVHLRKGDVEQAVAILRRAVKAQPDYATAHYHLGVALLQQGDQKGAREALRAALAGGAFPEADQARAQLARIGESEGGSR